MTDDEQKQKIEQEITQYLSDPAKMYEAWYSNVYQTKTNAATHPVGYLPDFDGIKDRFEQWFKNRQNWLKENFCPIWKKWRGTPKFHEKRELIVAITADATSIVLIPGIHIYHIPVLVAILVTDGYFNRLCADRPEN